MYLAKERGRARVELFDNDIRVRFIHRLSTEQELRHALGRGELVVHYQPFVSLAASRIVGVEALVRWEHPTRGLVLPSDFISAAEETELILPLGAWALEQACTQLAAWRTAGLVDRAFTVSVNVSARQLSREDFPETVDAALAQAGLEPSALCLEITESVVLVDTPIALRNLSQLKERGIAIALDDFGVGSSSLSRIQELPPIDVIKVDRSFVAALGDNASAGALLRGVLGLARSLGLAAIAEGVEREDQLEELTAFGFALAQGFLLGRPQPAAELEVILAAPARHAA
jgi:EAL domain-containing protein (putative c-di-GMP-specific phosphodiesterase class I)